MSFRLSCLELVSVAKKFKKAEKQLLAIAGPKKQQFIDLGFKYSKKKRGSLDGKTTHQGLNTEQLMKVVKAP